MILVAGRVRVQSARRAEALEICQKNAEASRAEAGCVSYRFYTDPDDPDVLFVFEEWRDADALEAHFREPHLQAFMRQIPDFVAEPVSVTRYVVSAAGKL